MSNFKALILAAGMGTRMKSEIPKVLHKVCGKELCAWVIDASKAAGAAEAVAVIGHKADLVRNSLDGACEFAVQAEQKGTGHAVICAKELLDAEYTLILTGDTPLIRSESLKGAVDFHVENGLSATVITAVLPDATGYGRIVRDENGNVLKIVEQKDATEEEKAICEINSGMYVFKTSDLLYALDKITPNNAQGEYYLTDTLEILRNSGKTIGACVIGDNDEVRGINDRVQLSEAECIMRERIVMEHQKNGVTIRNPETVMIEPGVEIGTDTEIEQNVLIKSGTKIGKNCLIGMGTTLDGAVICDGVTVLSSMILNSEVREGTTVGPFTYVRPDLEG